MTMQYVGLASVYDALIYDMPYDKWAEFVFKKLDGAQSVLELACGTGNLTERLTRRYNVTSLDISAEMLEVAAEKTRRTGRRPMLVNADMCEFLLNKPVDAIVCACDGINYLTTPEKVKQAFLNANGNLKEGGKFIFDISTEYKLKKTDGQLYSEDSDSTTYVWRNSFDEKSKLITMDITFFVTCDGENYTRFDETHVQRAHGVDELRAWLSETGFTVISVTDDYSDTEADENSMRVTFCAEKVR